MLASATPLVIAVSVTDRAAVPRARCVISAELAPPGHAPRITSPTAISGGSRQGDRKTPGEQGSNSIGRSARR